MEWQENLILTIDKYKCKNQSDYLVLIPVYNETNVIAYLRPITKDYLKTMPECIELLSRWREENPMLSPASFNITYERTQLWIENLVINNNNRILFMIQNFSGEYLGHVGFTSFNYPIRSAEIDSVLKGVKVGYPQLMYYSLMTLIEWGIKNLNLKHISLEVLDNNVRAIELYKNLGFVEQYKIPLEKIQLVDEIKWKPCKDIGKTDAEKYYLVMKYM